MGVGVLVVLVLVVVVVVVGKSRNILPLFQHQSLLNNWAGPAAAALTADAGAATGLSLRVMDEPCGPRLNTTSTQRSPHPLTALSLLESALSQTQGGFGQILITARGFGVK